MSTCTLRAVINSTANQNTYASGSFTPTAGDLLVVAFSPGVLTGTTAQGVSASANGITFTEVTAVAAVRASVDDARLFVADQLVPSSPAAMTITADAGGSANGMVGYVVSVDSLTRTGLSAIRAKGSTNQAATAVPAVTMDQAALTGNPVLTFMWNATQPATMTPPTSFTEPSSPAADVGYATPTRGGDMAFRNSGHTSATVTWGSSSATASASIAVELDTSIGTTSKSGTDTVSVAETGALVATSSMVDTVSFADAGALAVTAAGTDTVTGSDASSVQAAASTTDTASVTDISSVNATAAGTDTVSFAESSTLAVLTADGGTATDTGALAATLAGTDTSALSESSSVVDLGTTLASSDTATQTDASAVVAGISSSDTVTTADTAALSTSTATTDDATQTEAGTLLAAVGSTDSATVDDTSTLIGYPGGVDAALMTETSSIVISVAALDELAQAEAGQLLAQLLGTDTATLDEISAVVRRDLRDITIVVGDPRRNPLEVGSAVGRALPVIGAASIHPLTIGEART